MRENFNDLEIEACSLAKSWNIEPKLTWKRQKKIVKLFTQNFPYYLSSFIFSSFCVHPVFVTKAFFAVLNTLKTKQKKIFRPSIFFSLIIVLGCSTCVFFTENVTMPSSVIVSTTYQKSCTSVKYFLSYSANRRTDRQTDGNERPYFSEST